MSYYRRLIEESEKKRILSMHSKYKENPRILNIREAYSAQAGEGYDSVEACKKELPYNVATKLGINWNEAKKSWGSKGTSQENLQLKNAMCDGWRIGDSKDGGTATPTTDQSKQQVSGEDVNKYVEGQLVTPEWEQGKIAEGLPKDILDKFKTLPNYYYGEINNMTFDDPNKYIWAFSSTQKEENVYYLADGRKLKYSYDPKTDQSIWENLGNWLQGTIPGATVTPGGTQTKTEDKKYSEEYITPTFGQTPKAD